MESSAEYSKSHPDDIEPDMDGSQLDTFSELSWPSPSRTVPYVSYKGDEWLSRIAEQLADALKKAKSRKHDHEEDLPANLSKGS